MTEAAKPTMRIVKGGAADHEPAPAAPPPEGWTPDDDQLALALAEDLRDKLAFFHGDWRMYDGGYWRKRDASSLRKHVRLFLRRWRVNGVRVSQTRIKSLTAMLEDDLHIEDHVLMERQAGQRRYVNLTNGMFDLEALEFIPTHKPDLYLTTQLDFPYDEDATCPTFLKFLHTSLVQPDSAETDPELVRLVCEGLAYSMTARTDLKAMFWLVGKPDSGKSTFIATLKAIMGNLHTTVDLSQLGNNDYILATIIGKRVVTCTEAASNSVLPDHLFKALVGGSDEVQANIKYKDPITFRPECKMWWAMNDAPRVLDRSGATTGRIHIIPYNRTIPPSERIPNLEHRLAAERSGIFNLMVTHYKRLLRWGGFEPCAQSEEARREYISENDTEAAFVRDCCEVHPSYRVQSSELYGRYKAWCDEFGFKPKNFNQMAAEWRRLGFVRTKIGDHFWQGVRVRPRN